MMPKKMPKNKKTLFCFGAGYCARHLSASLMKEGWTIWGSSRNPKRIKTPPTFLFDGERKSLEIAKILQKSAHILISVPPDMRGDRVFRHHGEDILKAHEEKRLLWLGYLSTTGVYGERRGGWVSESSYPRPRTERSLARFKAERAWLSLFERHGVPVHIFRLAGIYGRGRNVLETLWRGGAKRYHKRGQRFSRIHQEDITRILRASMENPRGGRIYNLCDDEAAAASEVSRYGAGLLGLPPPPLQPLELAKSLSPMAKSFYSESKRVQNARVKRELGVRLLYPTYREGLRALLPSLSRQKRSSS